MEESFVSVDGNRIRYLEAGDGQPLVLLHGGAIDAAHVTWGEVIEPLAASFRVVAPDLLGYGASDLPDGPYSIDRHVGVVAGLLESLGLEAPAVAGNSLGGAVGLGLASRDPDRIASLTVIDGYGLGSTLPNGTLSYALARVKVLNEAAVAVLRRSRRLTRLSLANLVHDLDSISRDAVDAVYEELQRPTAGEAFRRFRAAEVGRNGYRTTFEDRFADVDVPTLVVHGDQDALFPVEWAERAARRLPAGELAVLENCGHWAPRDRPAAVIEQIEHGAEMA